MWFMVIADSVNYGYDTCDLWWLLILLTMAMIHVIYGDADSVN